MFNYNESNCCTLILFFSPRFHVHFENNQSRKDAKTSNLFCYIWFSDSAEDVTIVGITKGTILF